MQKYLIYTLSTVLILLLISCANDQLDKVASLGTAPADSSSSSSSSSSGGGSDVPDCILFKMAGDNQNASVNTELPANLEVYATDANGEPNANQTVRFLVTTGTGAILAQSSVNTDANGMATNTLTLGPTSGNYAVTAICGTNSIIYSATAYNLNTATSITSISDTSLSANTGDQVSGLTVLVTNAAGDPLSGKTVVFSITQGTGATLTSNTVVTGANGQASAEITLGTLAGNYKVRASLGALTPVTFTISATVATCFLSKTIGDNQTGNVNSQLQNQLKVRATFANGDPISDRSIQFTNISSNIGALSTSIATTDNDGYASINYTFGNSTGSYVVRAICGTSSVDFASSAYNSTATANLTAESDTQISAYVGDTVNGLAVRVLNALNLGIPNKTISYTIIQQPTGAGASVSSPSVTDVNGDTYVDLTVGSIEGTYKVRASLDGYNVTFTINATPAPCYLTKISGDAQNSAINTPINPLQIKATNGSGNAITSRSIQFLAIGTNVGTFNPVNGLATTNGSGNASIGYTLGAVAGTYLVRAICGTSSVDFSATTYDPTIPSSLIAVSSNTQSAYTGAGVTLTTKVLNSQGTALQNVRVDYVITQGGGASLSLDHDNTLANGNVSSALTLGSNAGIYIATATIHGTSISQTFTITTSIEPCYLTKTSGDTQTAAISTALSSLQVRATDASGNALISKNVQFITMGNNSGTFSPANGTATTNGTGYASIGYTLGASIGNYVIRAICGTSSVDFSATAYDPTTPASLTAVTNTTQSAYTGALVTLTTKVLNSQGTALESVRVDYAITQGSGASLSLDHDNTLANGNVSSALTLGSNAGIYIATATIHGTSISQTFTVTTSIEPCYLTKTSGDTQTAAINNPLSSLQVKASDASGNPLTSKSLQFIVIGSNTGTFSPVNGAATTNGTGYASIGYTLGATTGTYTVRAVCGTGSVDFTATAYDPSTPASLVAISNTNQSAYTGALVTLTSRVLNSQSTALENVQVDYAITQGSGASLSVDHDHSLGNGNAASTLTLGSDAGIYIVTATIHGTSYSQTFTITSSVEPCYLSKTSGDSQNAAISTPLSSLQVRAINASGNALISRSIQFLTIGTNTGTLSPVNGLATTSGTGYASIGYTLGATAGTYTVRAICGTASVDFSATAYDPTVPASLSAISSTNQSAYTGAQVTLTTRVFNSQNTALQSVQVDYAITQGSGASLSAANDSSLANGNASSVITVGSNPAIYIATATIHGTSISQTFTITASVEPCYLSKTSGDSQTAATNGILSSLQVRAINASGSALTSRSIQYLAIGTNTGTFNPVNGLATTDGTGYASIGYTLGAATGSYTVRAVCGTSSVDFSATGVSATATAGLTANIDPTITAYTSTTVSGLSVKATNGLGGALSGKTVSYSIIQQPGSDASLSSPANTDVNGNTYANLTLGSSDGIYKVQASLDGYTVTFTVIASIAPCYLTKTAGDNQTVAINQGATDLQVRALDGGGNAITGRSVQFVTISTNTGSPASGSSSTNGTGYASYSYTLGANTGTYTIRAICGTSSVDFSVTGYNPNTPASLTAVTNNTFSAYTGAGVSITAKVLNSQGTPLTGTQVDFAVSQGPGASFNPANANSAAVTGNATSTLTIGANPGIYIVTATIHGTSYSQTFTITASIEPCYLIKYSGDTQTAATSNPLTNSIGVIATDALNNPLSNRIITYIIASIPTSATGQSLSTSSYATDVNGISATSLTLGNTAGTYTVRAVCGTSSLDFTETAIDANKITTLTAISATSQNGYTTQWLSSPITIRAKNALGTAKPGKSVVFSVTQGSGVTLGTANATTNDPNGDASTTVKLGSAEGTYRITATVTNTDNSTATQTFEITATNEPTAVCMLVKTDGDDQIGDLSAQLSTSFKVKAVDPGNNVLAGQNITYTIIQGDGHESLTATSGTTGSDGFSTTRLTLGLAAQTYKVRALCGTSSVDFTATAINISAACNLSRVSSASQTATIGTQLTNNITVLAKDYYNNVAANKTINFTLSQGSGAIIGNPTRTSDVNGLASTTFTVGAATGTYKVTAICGTSMVQFDIEAIAGMGNCAGQVPIFSGAQSTTIISSRTIKVNWNQATDTITPQAQINYSIYYSSTANTAAGVLAEGIKDTVVGTSYYLATGLSPSTTYNFVVRATNSCPGGTETNTSLATGATPAFTGPTFPSNVSITSITPLTASSIMINWNAATDTHNPPTSQANLIYKVYRAASNSYNALDINTAVATVTGTTSATISGLGLNEYYWYIVKATNQTNETSENLPLVWGSPLMTFVSNQLDCNGPNNTYLGSDPTILFRQYGSGTGLGNTCYPHIFKFDLSNIPTSITNATLKLYQTTYSDGTNDEKLIFYRLLAAYNQTTVTFNNMPAKSSSYATIQHTSGTGWKSFNITSLVQDLITYKNAGIYMWNQDMDTAWNQWAHESYPTVANRPQLQITFNTGETVTFSTVFGTVGVPIGSPYFTGLSTVIPTAGDCLQLTWTAAVDNDAASLIRYKIYKASTQSGVDFGSGSYLTTSDAGATYYNDCTVSLAQEEWYGVRSLDTSGNIDTNVVKVQGFGPLHAMDTMVSETNQSTQYQSSTALKIYDGWDRANNNRRFVLVKIPYYSLSLLPTSVSNAKLKLKPYINNNCNHSYLKASQPTYYWYQNVTWPYRPTFDTNTPITNVWDATNSYSTFEITTIFNNWQNGNAYNQGLIVWFTSGANDYDCQPYSTETATVANRPVLEITTQQGALRTYYLNTYNPTYDYDIWFTGITGATPGTDNCINVTWNQAADEDPTSVTYNIYRASTQGGVNFSGTPLATSTPGATNYNDCSVSAGGEYWYGVRSVDSTNHTDSNAVKIQAFAPIYAYDTYLSEVSGQQSTDYHTATTMKLYDGWDRTNNNRKFGLIKLPASTLSLLPSSVSQAKLKFKPYNCANCAHSYLKIQQPLSYWYQTQTWTYRPQLDGNTYITNAYDTPNNYSVFEITNIFNGWQSGSYSNYGLELFWVSGANDYSTELYTTEATTESNRPVLEITVGGALRTYYLNPINPTYEYYVWFAGITGATQTIDGCISITWNTAADETPANVTYKVYRALTQNGVDFTQNTRIDDGSLVGVTSYKDCNISQGKVYYYGVRAVDSGNNTESNTAVVNSPAPIICYDTYVSGNAQTTNYATSTQDQSYYSGTTANIRRIYFKIHNNAMTNLPTSPQYSKLRFDCGGTCYWQYSMINPVTGSDWAEDTITYANAPGVRSENTTWAADTSYYSDILSFYNNWKSSNWPNYGLQLYFTNEGYCMTGNPGGMYSTEYATLANHPRLEVKTGTGLTFTFYCVDNVGYQPTP